MAGRDDQPPARLARRAQPSSVLGMPSAADLAEYANVFPELPHEMWDEVRELMRQKRQLDKATSRRKTTGQWLGFVIALAFLGVSAWLINGGHDTAGVILGSVDLVALVAVFVTGRLTGRGGGGASDPAGGPEALQP